MPPAVGASGEQPTQRQLLLRCSGHEGSIFRLRWLPPGPGNATHHTLVSVSDDRSLRVWTLPKQSPASPGTLGGGEPPVVSASQVG